MESHRKQIPDIRKYFDPTHDQHLRNRYSQVGDDAYVKAFFASSVPGSSPKSYEISAWTITTQDPGDTFMKYTAAAFDMFNYRMLAEWIYQKNSRRIDLFQGFKKDIFRYLYFSKAYTRIDGTRPPAAEGKTAEEWWDYINKVRLPLTRRGQVNRTTAEYQRFVPLLQSFKSEMDTVLGQVERSANDMLHNDLGLPYIDVLLDMTPVPFNVLKPGRKRYKDGKVQDPVISVKAHVVDPSIPGWATDIEHLATYFNESKLTCIGIAIRLAISDYKLITGADVAPVLCLDDLLLSLDMSTRIPMIKLLLKKAQDRQLMVFTHDRAFFETMRMMIQERRSDGEWIFYEMLERKNATPGSIPKPMFFPSKTYRDKVEYHYEQGDYPAAVNYLRKYCERQLKRLLPSNMQLISKPNGEIEAADLSTLINKMGSELRQLYDIPLLTLPSLSVYRKRLMNPLSHDDAHTPVYKAEIMDALSEIDKVQVIADSKHTICKGQAVHRDDFTMYIVNGTDSEVVEFTVMEEWTKIKIGGVSYYKDVKVRVTASTNLIICPIQDYDSLRAIFNALCVSLHLDQAPAVPPQFDTTITNRYTHQLLSAI